MASYGLHHFSLTSVIQTAPPTSGIFFKNNFKYLVLVSRVVDDGEGSSKDTFGKPYNAWSLEEKKIVSNISYLETIQSALLSVVRISFIRTSFSELSHFFCHSQFAKFYGKKKLSLFSF